MSQKLNANFLIELIKTCILSQSIYEVIKPHLDFSFIENQEYKAIIKYIADYHSATNKVPTIGTISQNLPQQPEILKVIAQIREANVHDKKDELLKQFETFIRRKRFQKLHRDSYEMYDKGEQDKAIDLFIQEAESLHSFTLLAQVHSRIFTDFDKRQAERKATDFSSVKLPTGIPQFDHHTHGGPELGTAMLAVARSGAGKSTLLRWLGFNFAFRGFSGVHFQAEGKKKQVEDAYDAMWTGVPLNDIKKGDLSTQDYNVIEKARKAYIAQAGEIIVVSFEQFDTASIAECRQILIDIMRVHDIKWATFDYLEKFNPGDGRRYGTNAEGDRSRKLAVAEKIVNIATEFNIFTATATQANDIDKKDWNDPSWTITRNNISNLRATIDPFAYCLTLNQTLDENDNDIMRIHEEKLREYKINSWEQTYYIQQQRNVGRFIDVAKTKQLFWDDVNKKLVKNPPKKTPMVA